MELGKCQMVYSQVFWDIQIFHGHLYFVYLEIYHIVFLTVIHYTQRPMHTSLGEF